MYKIFQIFIQTLSPLPYLCFSILLLPKILSLPLTHIPSTPARLRSLSGGERPSSCQKNPNLGTLSSHRFCSTLAKSAPSSIPKNRAFTSSENPQTPRYLLSRSLTLSLTSPTHYVVTCRAGWRLRNSSSGSGSGLKDHLKDPIALLMPRSSSR